jgi:hypothetical protein
MRFFPLLLTCLLLALWPRPAQAEVRRCVTAGGQTIFTDRKCVEVDAVERLPRAEVPGAARLLRAGGCARTLQDLVFEMTSAIDTRDANRMAGLYHWPGTSADAGYRIWMRLDAIANRPLVDIVPVMPASSPVPSSSTGDSGDTDDGESSMPTPPADGELYPQTTVRRNPVALRVEQTIGNSATPSRTVFGLTHYFGCWWLRF